MTIKKLRVKRGLKKNLPALDVGELALTTDESKLYVGHADGNQGLVTDKELTLVNTEIGKVTTQLAQNADKDSFDTVTKIEPLHITTFDGTNQAFHPSVKYFPSGWAGETRKFWMAFTPYPIGGKPYVDRWESPSMVYSEDGINWYKRANAPDPLIDLTQEQIDRKDFFSDPCIVMNGNTMEVWYRHTNGSNTSITNIYRISSLDGENWTAPEMVLNSEAVNNGFANMETMRSQQVFYENGKYISYYGLQGGSGGLWKAESNDPSTGIWENLVEIKLINAPSDMKIWDLWHIGMAKEDGVYHLTGYDTRKNSIKHFTSADGVTFAYQNDIIKTDSSSVITNYQVCYQAVPVKVGSDWLLYASGTFKDFNSGRRNGIGLFAGKSLDKLFPVEVGGNRRKYFITSPFLTNNPTMQDAIYGTYYNDKTGIYSGFGMSFGATFRSPAWYDNFRKRQILYFFDDVRPPYVAPEHEGIIWRNIDTKEVWLAVGTASLDDWFPLNPNIQINKKMVINQQRTNVTSENILTITGAYRLVINAKGSSTTVSNLTGTIYDGQELFIMNAITSPITLQNNASGSGAIRLKGGVDRVLAQYEAITLIAVGTTWYEK